VPIISFTERDLLRDKVVEPAWYRLRIESIGEKPSKDGGSINYPVDATVVKNSDNGSTEFSGVPIEWNFNSKAIGFAKGFLASFGVDLAPGERYDLSSAAGKELDVYVDTKNYDNRLLNNVSHKYRPARD